VFAVLYEYDGGGAGQGDSSGARMEKLKVFGVGLLVERRV
jgi:hypothetical protein